MNKPFCLGSSLLPMTVDDPVIHILPLDKLDNITLLVMHGSYLANLDLGGLAVNIQCPSYNETYEPLCKLRMYDVCSTYPNLMSDASLYSLFGGERTVQIEQNG